LSESLPERIQRDVALIDQLLDAYADLLVLVEKQEPDLV
jgi:hypothetical protein